MKHTLSFVLLAAAVLLSACGGKNERLLPSATGTIYECLAVIPNKALSQASLDRITASEVLHPTGSAYQQPVTTDYDVVKSIMAADMPCMPQMEPYFVMNQVTMANFDSYLKPTRNILIVDIDADKYTQTKAKVSTDVWATPQAVYRIQAPTQEAFVDYWLQNGEAVREWFVREELRRQTLFYRANTNKDARQRLQSEFRCDMLVPEDYRLIMDTTLSDDVRLLWCCNNKGAMRRDLVVYSYPYTDDSTFTAGYLNRKRDAVLSQVVSASVPGSYMGTEYRIMPPEVQTIASLDPKYINGFYATEVRGLWKIYHGEAMGGPYVSHTRLDQLQGRVITAEAFLFAAGQKKRNALRQSEAILYTLTLPTDTIR